MLQERVEQALKRDIGIAACMLLARDLGLRREEAVQSYKSLHTWERLLERGATRLPVVFGTKTGRPRDVTVLNADRLEEALAFALDVTTARNGYLLEGKGLKEVLKFFDNQMTALGMVGVHSFHSIRYAYAVEAINYHLSVGHSLREATAMTSIDLGHGDGRGRYIKSVYGRSLMVEHQQNSASLASANEASES